MDDDGDGLIEIWTLTELNHMRFNLAGTSYKSSSGARGDTSGCGTDAAAAVAAGGAANQCHGYELMTDLDFSDPTATGYQAAWDPEVQVPKGNNAGSGWTPIGTIVNRRSNAFTGTFDGNDHTIKNLYINLRASHQIHAGLFGYAEQATMRNVGLTGEHMSVKAQYSNPASARDCAAGGLAGMAHEGSQIINCHATGSVSATNTHGQTRTYAGGLVGYVVGTVTNCYATGTVFSNLYAGGLVGCFGSLLRIGGSIRNGYATGNVTASSSSQQMLMPVAWWETIRAWFSMSTPQEMCPPAAAPVPPMPVAWWETTMMARLSMATPQEA